MNKPPLLRHLSPWRMNELGSVTIHILHKYMHGSPRKQIQHYFHSFLTFNFFIPYHLHANGGSTCT